MDRQQVFVGAIPQDTDFLLTNKNVMLALGYALQMALGTTTQVDGLACAPTSPATMTVNVAPGSITTQGVVDQTAYGSVAADTTRSVVKQGLIQDTTNFSCPAPGTVGQSVVYLVQAAFSEVDGGATVLPYYNASNPAAPYNGPGNAGTSNNTVRQGKCVLSLKAGVAANTGSQVTPSADVGYTPLYAITVANGQTTITSGSIATINGAPILLEKLKDKISQATGDARYMLITQLNSWEATDTGTANAKAATLSPAPSGYTAGMRVSLLIGTVNTTAATANFNSLGAKTIKKLSSSGTLVDVAAGDLPAGVLIDLEYDGTVFQILSRSLPSSVTLNNVAYGTTTNSGNTYSVTTTPSFASLTAGQEILATFNAANTGAATLNPNAIGATNLKDAIGGALATGSIVANKTYLLVYDGTNLRVIDTVAFTSYGTTTNSGNTYSVTTNEPFGALFTGQTLEITFNAANTGAATLNPNGLGAISLKNNIGGALATGSIVANRTYILVYDGTNFRVLDSAVYLSYGTTTNSGNAYSVTTNPSFGALFVGQHMSLTFNAANTGAVTLNPNSIGATTVQDANGNALTSGQIIANRTYLLAYDGTNLRVMNLISQNLPTGTVVEKSVTLNTANTACSVAIPMDDTIPQVTEGTEIFSQANSAASATTKVRVRCMITVCGPANPTAAALFIDGAANAVAASFGIASTGNPTIIAFEYEHTPGDTSSHTYSVRFGAASAASLRINGTGTGRLLGGVCQSSLVIEEIAP